MFRLLLMLGILFVLLVVVGNLWVRIIHPLLFKELIEDKLDDAVEQKVLKEADKKAAEILSHEETEDEG